MQESVLVSELDVEGLSLLLPCNDLRVTRESVFDMLRDVLGARGSHLMLTCVKARVSPSTNGRSITAD
jgi:hypothetical protein